ncbi:MAG TPA: phage integrase SAM-like domain-containing protein, partial [Bacteroidales bacterium]|nr:phage integrase SAM-like domain-containing protein [Bacteroidales bacterium]
MTTKVKLRRKAISGNRQSLYLDFYPPIPHPETGEPTRRDFLGLYLFDNPKNPLDKQHNKEIVQIAEQIKAKWENQLNKPEIYMDFERQQLKMKALSEKDFVDYFKRMADKRKGTSHDNWINTLNFINRFTGGKLRFADLNEQFCEDFKEYLLTTKSIKSETVILAQN